MAAGAASALEQDLGSDWVEVRLVRVGDAEPQVAVCVGSSGSHGLQEPVLQFLRIVKAVPRREVAMTTTE